MKYRQSRKKDMVQPLYTTFALADPAETDPESRYTAPTELGVEEAKNWVDHNKK